MPIEGQHHGLALDTKTGARWMARPSQGLSARVRTVALVRPEEGEAMPSFRASLGILDARPGVPPESVLETARAAVASVRVVEDAFVDVEPLLRGDGVPRVVVRFLEPAGNGADEDARAWSAAATMAEGVRAVAETVGLRVHRRAGGRWTPVATAEPDW